MKKLCIALTVALIACGSDDPEVARWEAMADETTITRDDWGIAHVHGPTDAHAVFGMIYAQAEDDFNRIEVNFLNSQGRLAEAEGEDAIWRDLRMKLFIDPAEMQALYAASPEWLRDLMDAWADGANYYLHSNRDVQPWPWTTVSACGWRARNNSTPGTAILPEGPPTGRRPQAAPLWPPTARWPISTPHSPPW